MKKKGHCPDGLMTRTRHTGLGGTEVCKHCGNGWPPYAQPPKCKERSRPGQDVFCEPYQGGAMERDGV